MKKEFRQKILSDLSASDADIVSTRERSSPVHVVYGGAHIFKMDTMDKLKKIGTRTVERYAPNFAEFARAMWLEGADQMPTVLEDIQTMEFRFADAPKKAAHDHPEASFIWDVFQKTIEKLSSDPIEDYRIDFEDGYGFRSDDEEDRHCNSASTELAAYLLKPGPKALTGFRIKSLQPETRVRAIRTLELFLKNLVEKTEGKLPQDFVVTLPKITNAQETSALASLLEQFETDFGLNKQSIGVEILIETPQSIPIMRELVESLEGRCTSAHFGAYDYTSSLGIAGNHQHLRHQACDFARNMMQVSLAPLGLRLSDSVTVEIPLPIHKGDNITITQIAENKLAVHRAWRKHFINVTKSQIDGFYQSWDLHPAQFAARYAAVFSFFLTARSEQQNRLRNFFDKATQAMTTGNLFDDVASAEGLLNFMKRGVGSGAFDKGDVCASIGLTLQEFEIGSFAGIMGARFARNVDSVN